MLAIMGQSADALFSTILRQLPHIFEEAEAAAAAGGGQPPSRGAKFALNIMLQVRAGPLDPASPRPCMPQPGACGLAWPGPLPTRAAPSMRCRA